MIFFVIFYKGFNHSKKYIGFPLHKSNEQSSEIGDTLESTQGLNKHFQPRNQILG